MIGNQSVRNKFGFYLDSRDREAQRLNGGVGQTEALGELNALNAALVLGQQCQPLVQGGAAVVR